MDEITAFMEHNLSQCGQLGWIAWYKCTRMVVTCVYKAELKKIRCPTLILHGKRDPLVPACHRVYLQQNIPGARLHRYPNGSHAIHYSHAEHFNNLVMQFLLE